jgi:predicted RND superfamily exporter protein
MTHSPLEISKSSSSSITTVIAQIIVTYPKRIVFVSLLIMALFLTALPTLYKDTRSDAFLAKDNPALIYKNQVKAQFGLSDPMVIAIVNNNEHGVFNPESLALVAWLSDQLAYMDNINSDRITSLATENNISGNEEGMDVIPFFETLSNEQLSADNIWQQVSDFPLYMGSLVAKNKQATLIVAELIDENKVEQTYQAILKLIEKAPISLGDQIHVAGEGAVSGYLGSYIDADAQKLNPVAGFVITMIILLAFRRFSPTLLANVIIAASVLVTLSIMALANVPFFVITNALPVILIGISVADSMHIFSYYFDLQARRPNDDKKQLIVETITEMWRPITLTTFTTIAGFIGLYFAAYMPPFKYFGLFTAVGVAIAWLYSLVFLPAAMAIIQPTASKAMIRQAKQGQNDKFSNLMVKLGRITLNYHKSVIIFFSIIMIIGLFSASKLIVDEDRIETFHHSEALYKADKAINQYLDGTNNLDVVIEANDIEGLFEPAVLNKMQALQKFILTQQNVKGATSIIDYLKQMNRSLTGGDKGQYLLPTDKALIAQYFLIYSASSDPTDFEEEIDYDYRIANMRVQFNKGSFQDTKGAIENIQRYIDDEFNNTNVSAKLSGRVNLNYHWIKDLGESHFVGLAISLFLVWLVSALLFQSFSAASFALIPVMSSILLVYAAMVLFNIKLGVGTSMFASVAIGLGVDFAIHTIDRLRSTFKLYAGDWDKALTALYPLTGRALFFNYIAIALGFGVLISSKVVPLMNFGIIVFISVSTSFFASMSLLPALIKATKPRFISDTIKPMSLEGTSVNNIPLTTPKSYVRVIRSLTIISLIASVSYFVFNKEAHAASTPESINIVNKVNNVNDGQQVTRKLTMTMIDKRGKTRVRETLAYRKYYEGEKRTVLFYKKPTNVKDTAFLTFDYKDTAKDDDQWLYLPAMRKVRRISASDRGDYFLGTDFTYEDMMLEGKLELSDYDFNVIRNESITLTTNETFNTIVLEGLPKNTEIAKDLGYARTLVWVDTTHWIVVKADYWDVKNQPLKHLEMSNIRLVDNIITRHVLTINNVKTSHKTIFEFSDVNYNSTVKDSLFSKRALKQGK